MVFKEGNQYWKVRTHWTKGKNREKIINKLKKENKEAYIRKPELREEIRNKQLGKKHTEETKRKMRISALKSVNKGRFKEGHIPWDTGLTKKTSHIIKRISESRIKDKNPNWHGGQSPYPYEFRKNRDKILKRDLFTCQECYRHQNELDKTLGVHHIDFNKQNNNPENLITLCNGCHNKTLNSRNSWIEYYQNKMNENLGVDLCQIS